jgi:leucyl-tRNA synthetase
MSDRYAYKELEPKWQRYWEEHKLFRAANPGEPGSERPKFYVLDFFPYPSGAGLHVGHPRGYIASDIIARYERMRGFNVLHPMGWDAFGLPAEQYAVETGIHPRITTQRNIATYKRQMGMIGLGYDWDREFATCDESYYRWTQWIFLQIHNSWYDPEHRWTDAAGREMVGAARPIDQLPIPPAVKAQGADAVAAYQDEHRLASLAEVAVNWCPALGTVLADEEVTSEGRSERGNHPVYRRPLRQWMLRITEYADRLLADLDQLDWPESIKVLQRNWIGRSAGAYVNFALAQRPDNIIRVFTTRPDTLFGATYLVLAPEHRLVSVITTPEYREEVEAYVAEAKQKSELDRMAETKVKTGVFTGAYALNPVNRERVPIWVADYVLISYGTGSIMAVPAHDTRDFEFSKEFGLPIIDVIYPPIVLGIQYFTEHAPDEARGAEKWKDRLARFLDKVVSAEAAPDQFEQLLGATTAPGGAGRESAAELYADSVLKQLPAVIEQRYGNSKVSWAQVLEGLAVQSFDELAERFRTAQFYSRAGGAFVAEGYNVNSPRAQAFAGQGDINGLCTPDAMSRITNWLEERDLGEATIQYKLRDWLFSRQRYWGEPFPILYRANGRALAEDEEALPVTLPEMEDFRPVASDDPNAEPQPPLSRAGEDWHVVERGGQKLRRELNTMPQWAGSCWYYLRFLDPQNDQAFAASAVEKYWMGGKLEDGSEKYGGVDLYMGGAEHAVLHLLYARFWHKVLYDLGHVSTPEPFHKLFNQGMIESYAFRREDKIIVARDRILRVVGKSAAEADVRPVRDDEPLNEEAQRIWEERGRGVTEAVANLLATKGEALIDGQSGAGVFEVVAKMSKALKNVINPDAIIRDYGADTLRLYEMFMGPLESSKPWNPRDIVGQHRFLQRVWQLVVVPEKPGQEPGGPWKLNPCIGDERDPEFERLLHVTIKQAEEGIGRFTFNTAIAPMHVWSREALKAKRIGRDQIERFLRVLSPFAPHICEELWQRLGHEQSIMLEAWPEYDPALTVEETVEMAVQVNGKLRGRIAVSADASEDEVLAAVRADEKIAAELVGKQIKRAIVVKGRLVNLVV